MHRIIGKTGLGRHPGQILLFAAGLLTAACGAASAPEPESARPEPAETASSAIFPALKDATDAPACVDSGQLSTRMYGAVEGDISWQSADMTCEGMPRPEGRGARLRFAGPHPSGEGTLVLIAAIPALERDRTGAELATRMTVIEEGQSRFFTSPDFDICWADIQQSEPIDESRNTVGGRIYCIAPINEVNGSATITVADIVFSGQIDWNGS